MYIYVLMHWCLVVRATRQGAYRFIKGWGQPADAARIEVICHCCSFTHVHFGVYMYIYVLMHRCLGVRATRQGA